MCEKQQQDGSSSVTSKHTLENFMSSDIQRVLHEHVSRDSSHFLVVVGGGEDEETLSCIILSRERNLKIPSPQRAWKWRIQQVFQVHKHSQYGVYMRRFHHLLRKISTLTHTKEVTVFVRLSIFPVSCQFQIFGPSKFQLRNSRHIQENNTFLFI